MKFFLNHFIIHKIKLNIHIQREREKIKNLNSWIVSYVSNIRDVPRKWLEWRKLVCPINGEIWEQPTRLDVRQQERSFIREAHAGFFARLWPRWYEQRQLTICRAQGGAWVDTRRSWCPKIHNHSYYRIALARESFFSVLKKHGLITYPYRIFWIIRKLSSTRFAEIQFRQINWDLKMSIKICKYTCRYDFKRF